MESSEKYPNASIDLSDPVVRFQYHKIREFLDNCGDNKERLKELQKKLEEKLSNEEDGTAQLLDKFRTLFKAKKSYKLSTIINAARKDYRANMKTTGWERA